MQTELGVSYEPERDDVLIKIYNQPSQILPTVEIVGDSVPITSRQIENDNLNIPTSPISTVDLTLSLQSSTPERKVPSPLNWQKLYQKYSQGLERLLPTDRDKEIARIAFKGGYQLDQVCELIASSPVGWTGAEVELIVELGENQFLERQEQLAIQEAEFAKKIEGERMIVNVVITPTESEQNYGGMSL